MKRAFSAFRDLQEDDFRVLAAIEAGQRKRQFVPKDELLAFARLDLPDLDYRLKRLDSLRMIQSVGRPYKGYRIFPRGYDFLALRALVRRGRLDSIGDLLAVGKESEVYEALGEGGRQVVLKLHRLGMTSFHQTSRLRGYLGPRRHFSWIYAARLAAEREFQAMRRLSRCVKVPEPLDQNRNAVLMSRFDGLRLSDLEVNDPQAMLESILRDVTEARSMGVIHGDLSEFNVLTEGDTHVIIDWPQWVESTHPQAGEIMGRDLANLLNFFQKRYALRPSGELRNLVEGLGRLGGRGSLRHPPGGALGRQKSDKPRSHRSG